MPYIRGRRLQFSGATQLIQCERLTTRHTTHTHTLSSTGVLCLFALGMLLRRTAVGPSIEYETQSFSMSFQQKTGGNG